MARTQRIGKPLPAKAVAAVDRVCAAKRRRSRGGSGDSRYRFAQVGEEPRIDSLLRVVGRQNDGFFAVTLERIRIRHVSPHIGYIAEQQAAHHLSGTPQERLITRLSGVDDRLEVLQLLSVRVVEAGVGNGAIEPRIGILVRVLNLGKVLCSQHGTAVVRRIAPEPSLHRYACGISEHRLGRRRGRVVGILVDVYQLVGVAGSNAEHEHGTDGSESKPSISRKVSITHFVEVSSDLRHGTIRRLKPMLRGFGDMLTSMPWSFLLL